jgi:hypothetical protein
MKDNFYIWKTVVRSSTNSRQTYFEFHLEETVHETLNKTLCVCLHSGSELFPRKIDQ